MIVFMFGRLCRSFQGKNLVCKWDSMVHISLGLKWSFAILYIQDKWNKCLRLKNTEPQEYIKLINRYEMILNRKSNAASKISNIELVELTAELLEIVMI